MFISSRFLHCSDSRICLAWQISRLVAVPWTMYKEMKVERKAEIEPSKSGFDIQTLGLKHLK